MEDPSITAGEMGASLPVKFQEGLPCSAHVDVDHDSDAAKYKSADGAVITCDANGEGDVHV